MFQLCAPAFTYLFISLLEIMLNTYLGVYNNLLVKIIVIISVVLFLNILCEKGFSTISWLIEFVALLSIVVILLNTGGCYPYEIQHAPTIHMPVDPIYMPSDVRADVVSVKHSYEHVPSYKRVPTGTSDPEYRS